MSFLASVSVGHWWDKVLQAFYTQLIAYEKQLPAAIDNPYSVAGNTTAVTLRTIRLNIRPRYLHARYIASLLCLPDGTVIYTYIM